jgi:RNA methyltransferase, TrmH family
MVPHSVILTAPPGTMKRITSRQNPLVASVRAVARGSEPGIFLDGQHLVAEAVSHATIRHALVAAEALERGETQALVDELERKGVEVVSVTAPVMAAVTSVKSSSTIVAVADPVPDRSEAIYGEVPSIPLVVIACDVQDPGNIGAIIRVAEAAGATGVVAAGHSADPFGPKALRGSMGSAFRLPVATAQSGDAIRAARARGCVVQAAVTRGGRSLFELDLTRPSAILIGSEGAGLRPAMTELADERFTIPMHPPVESLNAAVSAALVLYEARRQRQNAARRT